MQSMPRRLARHGAYLMHSLSPSGCSWAVTATEGLTALAFCIVNSGPFYLMTPSCLMLLLHLLYKNEKPSGLLVQRALPIF